VAEPLPMPSDRRRVERRTDPTLAELTLPELRRMMVTTILFVIVLLLFIWMVRTVIIAGILGIIVAMYMRPVYLWLLPRVSSQIVAAALTLTLLIVPLFGLTGYSYSEIADRGAYVNQHQDEIAKRIDDAVHRLPFMGSANTTASVKQAVIVASNYGTDILGGLRSALATLAVAATIFLFTAYYVLIDAEQIMTYVRARIPPRYGELSRALESNVRGVLYGAIYSTFLTQAIKSLIILAMNLAFDVPLAAVLAIISFIIGFFPIVGSWSVYVPVAAWLMIFRDAPGQAIAMLAIGFFVNTIYFYWMLVALVTGVYTFGLVGILLGPMLIGLLKAIFDTIMSAPAWQWSDHGELAEGR